MGNYFSVGGDANIALRFHETRESHRDLLNNRHANLIAYSVFAMRNLASDAREVLANSKFYLDDETHAFKFPPGISSVLITNLPSWAGGKKPWAAVNNHPNSHVHLTQTNCSDGKLEIVGFDGLII